MNFIAALLIFSSTTFAGNWVAPGKTQTIYWEQSACERESGEACVDATACPLDECNLRLVGGKPRLQRDAAKVADKAAKKDAEDKRQADRAARKARIAAQCAQATGLLKEICDDMIDK